MNPPELPPDLLAVLAALDSPGALARVFADLLTPAEVRHLGERWAIVKGLVAGESQRAVSESVGAGIATVSRGAQQLRYGAGGFQLAFDTLARLGLPDPRRR